MSKNDKLLFVAGFVATLGVGVFIIPKLQKKCSNKLYKSYNLKSFATGTELPLIRNNGGL